MKKVLMVLLTLVALLLAGCQSNEGQGKEISGEVKVAGSSTVYPITAAMAEEFNKLYPEVVVSVQSTGTGGDSGTSSFRAWLT